MPTVRSLILFDSNDPPTTAIEVAIKCPSDAPKATPTGFCAAPSATVASMLLSPHSAMKINEKV